MDQDDVPKETDGQKKEEDEMAKYKLDDYDKESSSIGMHSAYLLVNPLMRNSHGSLQ